MSEIATLEKLEQFLAQAPVSPAASAPRAQVSSPDAAPLNNGYQGSQLELFFSEVRYPTFVAKKKPTARLRETSSGSEGGSLKYRLRLH
jgi:hypothetical protein